MKNSNLLRNHYFLSIFDMSIYLSIHLCTYRFIYYISLYIFAHMATSILIVLNERPAIYISIFIFYVYYISIYLSIWISSILTRTTWLRISSHWWCWGRERRGRRGTASILSNYLIIYLSIYLSIYYLSMYLYTLTRTTWLRISSHWWCWGRERRARRGTVQIPRLRTCWTYTWQPR